MSFIFQALTLHFVVLSFDRYSRDDVIGEVMLELETLDLSNSDNAPVPISKEITPRSYKVKNIHHDLISTCIKRNMGKWRSTLYQN